MGTRSAPLVVAALLGVVVAAACRKNDNAVLDVTVTASGSPPGVITLHVTLTGPKGPWSEAYARNDAQPIAFPVTLTATLPASAAGDITIDIRAVDADNMTIATGHEGPREVRAGRRETIYVALDCAGGPCAADGGTGPGEDGGVNPGNPRCGNGHVDPDETCDTAIGPGDPGACPRPDCSDHIACTKDVLIGSGCTARCEHQEISTPLPSDGCCPKNANRMTDPDCSPTCGDGTVDEGETCDVGIAPGMPGACPLAQSDCASGNPCSNDVLHSAGTCSAICAHYPRTERTRMPPGDGCCPPGATNAVDADCPEVCGNGFQEANETCDVGIPGSCPTSCNRGDPSEVAFLQYSGCRASCVRFTIQDNVSGDGYCANDATYAVDTDCPYRCGNGQLEPGEACDAAATGFGACPTACPPSPSKCLRTALVGDAENCSARCAVTPIATCTSGDGCCPSGCTDDVDGDCSPTCGNGTLEPTLGEVCDTAIPAGRPGACPTRCTSANPCTEARLVSAGTCAAACVLLPITAPRAGDGCCPNGANFTVDVDCAPSCGNGIVESPAERCDHAIAGSCPMDCPRVGYCTPVQLQGAAVMCSARCVVSPITGCASGDDCCPLGCTAANDSDCSVICGDGVVGSAETCDRRITAGKPGACPRSCDDRDACTVDVASGSVEACTRSCSHIRITGCLPGDGCCPSGCTTLTDSDCAPACDDGRIGMGETCDPPGSCPTICPDDGDACTREKLVGTPSQCNAFCQRTPITACSGTSADACCPTGCTPATDSDC